MTIAAEQNGMFHPAVERDAHVTKGAKIGVVTDYLNRQLQDDRPRREPASSCSSARVPSLKKGDTIASIGVVKKGRLGSALRPDRAEDKRIRGEVSAWQLAPRAGPPAPLKESRAGGAGRAGRASRRRAIPGACPAVARREPEGERRRKVSDVSSRWGWGPFATGKNAEWGNLVGAPVER